MTEPDDRDLIQKCLRGDHTAFKELVIRYERPVYNLAFRMLGNPDEAKDIVQSTFVKAYENLTSFDSRRKFFSWLYRIAINESLNVQRSRKNTTAPGDNLPDVDRSPHDVLEEQEHADRVNHAIDRLPPDHRTVIVLHYFSRCSYEDISTILGIPERTVKSRLYDARERLRRLL